MSVRLVKFPLDAIYDSFENDKGCILGRYDCGIRNFASGKITLSLKYGKMRKLVKGTLYIEENWSPCVSKYLPYYYFTPNDRAKFRSVMSKYKDWIFRQ